jgi:hypothetical protein
MATAKEQIVLDHEDVVFVRKVLRKALREWSGKNIMGEPVRPKQAQEAREALKRLEATYYP